MDNQTPAEATVASRLRAVVYICAAANVAVAVLLLSTVTLTPSVPTFGPISGQELASLR